MGKIEQNKKILFFYAYMMPYTEAMILSLLTDFKCKMFVIYWGSDNKVQYISNYPDKIECYNRSNLSLQDLRFIVSSFSPDLVYVSGRMDKGYLKTIKKHLTKIPIVMGCDTQLNRGFKQKVQKILANFLYHQYFTHIWVAGKRQYAFAKYIKFKEEQILSNLYSGDTNLFSNIVKPKSIKRRILFVGRLEKIKNIDKLIDAWNKITDPIKDDWILTLIGEGVFEATAKQIKGIEVTGYLEQEKMIPYITESSFFCLPSINEPWGVVVHELSSAGMPLLLSRKVGAGDDFLINGFNGYFINENSTIDIKNGLLKLMKLDEDKFKTMGLRSKELAQRISSKISAASLISVLED
jgi:glycosyltransferase involved in cell wall biosynthesis